MRKVFIFLMVLTLSVIMVVSVALPVAAKAPNDNQPVAWAIAVSNSNNSPEGHIAEVISVKLLSDGTTEGNVVTHNWEESFGPIGKEFSTGFDQTATLFYEENGAKVAEFVAYMHQEATGFDYKIKLTLFDNGEPGKNDAFKWMIWLPDWGYPFEIWWPMFGPQDPQDPAFGLPITIGDGNFQVHLPRD